MGLIDIVDKLLNEVKVLGAVAVLSTALHSQNCGDCNKDGQTTIVDAYHAARIGSGLVVQTPDSLKYCDVDSSQDVNILDALIIAKHSTGQPVQLNCPLNKSITNKMYCFEFLDTIDQDNEIGISNETGNKFKQITNDRETQSNPSFRFVDGQLRVLFEQTEYHPISLVQVLNIFEHNLTSRRTSRVTDFSNNAFGCPKPWNKDFILGTYYDTHASGDIALYHIPTGTLLLATNDPHVDIEPSTSDLRNVYWFSNRGSPYGIYTAQLDVDITTPIPTLVASQPQRYNPDLEYGSSPSTLTDKLVYIETNPVTWENRVMERDLTRVGYTGPLTPWGFYNSPILLLDGTISFVELPSISSSFGQIGNLDPTTGQITYVPLPVPVRNIEYIEQ